MVRREALEMISASCLGTMKTSAEGRNRYCAGCELRAAFVPPTERGSETVRRTRLVRGELEIAASDDTPIQRS